MKRDAIWIPDADESISINTSREAKPSESHINGGRRKFVAGSEGSDDDE
jgi:hypothetical protein